MGEKETKWEVYIYEGRKWKLLFLQKADGSIQTFFFFFKSKLFVVQQMSLLEARLGMLCRQGGL